jgi:starch phosphorylase
MKLMMNGALTIGTLDGANVEMQAATGPENMYIFGLTAAEVEQIWLRGYRSTEFYANNENLSRIVTQLNVGFAGESFANLASYLLSGERGIADPYLCLADFESYRRTHGDMIRDYADKQKWNRMSLLNVAASGHFAADRSIEEYAKNIWNLQKMTND